MKKKDFKFLFILIGLILLVPFAVNAANCQSLLGPVQPGYPAYYVNMLFQIIKYLCIVALLIFSVIDFAKALTSEDNGALKKAGTKSAKRVVYLILLFFLPTLVFAMFGWLGIVDGDECINILSGN